MFTNVEESSTKIIEKLTEALKTEFQPDFIVSLCRRGMQARQCDLFLWDVLENSRLLIHEHACLDEDLRISSSHLELLPLIKRAYLEPVVEVVGNDTVCVVALSNGLTVFGCIACWYFDLPEIAPSQLQWLQIAANCVSIAGRYRPPSLSQSKLKREFLQALTTDFFPLTIQIQASCLPEFALGLPHIVVQIEAYNAVSHALISPQILVSPAEMTFLKCPSKLIAPMGSGLTCLVSQSGGTEPDETKEFMRERFLMLKSMLSYEIRLFVGVSNLHASRFGRAMNESSKALQTCKKVNADGGLIYYSECDVYGDPDADAYILSCIQEIYEHKDRYAFKAAYWYLASRKYTDVANHLGVSESTVRNSFKIVQRILPEIENPKWAFALIDAFRHFQHILEASS